MEVCSAAGQPALDLSYQLLRLLTSIDTIWYFLLLFFYQSGHVPIYLYSSFFYYNWSLQAFVALILSFMLLSVLSSSHFVYYIYFFDSLFFNGLFMLLYHTVQYYISTR